MGRTVMGRAEMGRAVMGRAGAGGLEASTEGVAGRHGSAT
ncbi:MAG: hypothetical protein QOI99_554 [Actinomycetota bacterium]|nr:hypothetical protein [Actinomycetota bacterium]